jgi:hypothetical protein
MAKTREAVWLFSRCGDSVQLSSTLWSSRNRNKRKKVKIRGSDVEEGEVESRNQRFKNRLAGLLDLLEHPKRSFGPQLAQSSPFDLSPPLLHSCSPRLPPAPREPLYTR